MSRATAFQPIVKGRNAVGRFGLLGFVAVAFFVYLIFLVLPVLLTFWFSFTNWDGLSPEFELVGLANFARAVSDGRVLRSWGVSGGMAVVALLLTNGIGLGLALLLNRSTKSALFYRSVFFYPILLSPIVVGILWRQLLNSNGIVDQVLVGMGLPAINFLGDPTISVVTITGVLVWQVVGFTMIVYLAGLQNIRKDLTDAARSDGANARQVFRHVTLPGLAPAITLNTVFVLIVAMKEYDLVVALTGGGPVHSSETVAFKILRDGLTGNEFGYGSAQAVLLFAGLAIVSMLVVIRLRRREEDLS